MARFPQRIFYERLKKLFQQTGITGQDVLAFIEQQKQEQQKASENNEKENAMEQTAGGE